MTALHCKLNSDLFTVGASTGRGSPTWPAKLQVGVLSTEERLYPALSRAAPHPPWPSHYTVDTLRLIHSLGRLSLTPFSVLKSTVIIQTPEFCLSGTLAWRNASTVLYRRRVFTSRTFSHFVMLQPQTWVYLIWILNYTMADYNSEIKWKSLWFPSSSLQIQIGEMHIYVFYTFHSVLYHLYLQLKLLIFWVLCLPAFHIWPLLCRTDNAQSDWMALWFWGLAAHFHLDLGQDFERDIQIHPSFFWFAGPAKDKHDASSTMCKLGACFVQIYLQ